MLDIKHRPESGPGAPATVFRMQIQVRDRFRGSQQHSQLQLCVPLVAFIEDAYRRAVTSALAELSGEDGTA